MTIEDKKEVQRMILLAIDEFKKVSLGFRNQRIIDRATDSYGAINQKTANGLYLPLSGGSFDPGAVVVTEGVSYDTGTVAGTKYGISASDKIGFYGKSPISQQANTAGNTTAGATYGANEQKMLNDSYSVLRNIGLLS